MKMSINFCWNKAAECQRLAGVDHSVRNFFIRSRNSWIELANRLAVIGDATRARHEEAWDSIIAGAAGTDDEFSKVNKRGPHRLHSQQPSPANDD
jgi:hypothetical protein